jgi:hypothetical protein
MELLLTSQRSTMNDEQCIKINVLDVDLLRGSTCFDTYRSPVNERMSETHATRASKILQTTPQNYETTQSSDPLKIMVAVDGNGRVVKVGVLALQGAFEEHEKCLRAVGCTTVQVRTPLVDVESKRCESNDDGLTEHVHFLPP